MPMTRLALALVSLLLTGCATRLAHFQNFSQAGMAYTAASRVALRDAGSEAIDNDTTLLLMARAPLDEEARRAELRKRNELLRERLRILAELERHSTVLESYFQALFALADEKTAKAAGEAAKKLSAELTKASGSFKAASIGGVSIASKLPAVVKLAVRGMRIKALETELNLRAETIEREIALQEAAFAVVNQIAQTDRKLWLAAMQTNEVALPFARAGELPQNWAERRKLALTLQNRVASADAAVKAAAKLREAFIVLVQSRDATPELATLIAEVRMFAAEVR